LAGIPPVLQRATKKDSVNFGLARHLVEVDPVADPPVCKIFDFRKFKYETVKTQARARHEPVELEIRDNQIKEKG
jgi:translation initiation factor IF-3